ncbi:Glu/Leu/Phe/Val family dehydrogenase [Aminobacter sp. HY435]|uniref:Glu/Leu/Phe/Val family dehydrogenase n=1 Tax=Aminobacter sp. HY435 TaxID=2970917 RepID=UPI0022B943AF|nr:Glu/Leu/Phe/Val dehydrogenase dimerization domain-containing protein [Aminobacter sp. HY435]
MLNVLKPHHSTLAAGTTLELIDITAEAARMPGFDSHEQVWLGRDSVRGLTAIVAVHTTVLGPALGGTRIWPHASFEAGVTDALRLSRGMTFKSAIAGLPLGGGKAVIIADAKTEKTPQMLEAYAEMLNALEGQYITAEDVGMTLADADFLAARARNVSGTTRGGSGNPSPFTAQGTFLGLKAALGHRTGGDKLSGVRVAVQGLGSVGWSLCEKLHAEGAILTVSDLDTVRTDRAAEKFGAAVVEGNAIIAADVDIFAPCALGGILSADTIPQLKAGIVAGAANNQLATADDGERLVERGILYAPDYVINAGGVINVAAEMADGGYDVATVTPRVARIADTLTAIFRRAEREGRTTDAVAEAMAREIVEAARK